MAWDAALAGNDDGLLLETSRHSGRLIIEWGFPPAAIGIVQDLVSRGYRAAYFDGDHATALACWKLRRPDADDTIWQAQADGLDAITEAIEGAYRSRRIQTLAPGPIHLPPEEICRLLGLEP